MAMIEKWCKFLDIGSHAGALLTDLSKAFDYIDHEFDDIDQAFDYIDHDYIDHDCQTTCLCF